MQTVTGLPIEGTLIIINADKRGSAIVVPPQKGRARLDTLMVRADRVSLVDADGIEHRLLGASPVDARTAVELGDVLVREQSVDQDDFVEYPVKIDIDVTAPGFDDEEQSGPTP